MEGAAMNQPLPEPPIQESVADINTIQPQLQQQPQTQPQPPQEQTESQPQPQSLQIELPPQAQGQAEPQSQSLNKDTSSPINDEQVLKPITPETLELLLARDQEIIELKRRVARMAELMESTMDACEKFGRDVLAADNELMVLLEREVERRDRPEWEATTRPHTPGAAPFQHH